jgi:hypothetical protein
MQRCCDAGGTIADYNYMEMTMYCICHRLLEAASHKSIYFLDAPHWPRYR